jgi:putative ABC transport system permease protein
MLDRKLWRDMSALRGQIISIALVVAAGISVFVASISTYDSLLSGRDRFYETARFPQVFVTLKRAPLAILSTLQNIPGIAAIEPRIVRDVIVD